MPYKYIFISILFCTVLFVGACKEVGPGARMGGGFEMKERIQSKATLAQEKVQTLLLEGKDVSAIVIKMKQVPVVMRKKGPVAGEAFLNEILKDIAALESSETKSPSGDLENSGLFSEEKPVEMLGYDGQIMELFLSRDDQYLFFNNLNDPSVNTNLHYAKRIDVGRFQYIGEVKGVNTTALEGVPTLDSNGNFYFISTRSFDKTHSTIYQGRYKNGAVENVKIVGGNVNGRKPPIFNMGTEISADGQTLYYSEAIGQSGGKPPKDSNLKFGYKQDNKFIVPSNVDYIMKNINTPDELEYAAAITSDELELFFNRSKMLVQGKQTVGLDLKILHATRKSKTEPFNKPKRLETIKGFVEGAAMTSDNRILYYHKKNKDGVFRIYRVERLR